MNHTLLEKKLIEDGFMNQYGIILKGNFKNKYTLTEINRKGPNGEVIVTITQNYTDTKSLQHFEVVLSANDYHEAMHVKNMMQIMVDQAAISAVIAPLFTQIVKKSQETVQKIVDAEKVEKGERQLTKSERISFSNLHMYRHGVDFPKEAMTCSKLCQKVSGKILW